MTDLTVAVFFTRNTGLPATGLVLADIDLYLTAQDRATGVDTVIWAGAGINPTEELDNVGAYMRIYTLADLDAYNYYVRGTYTGAVVLDVDDVTGSAGLLEIPIGTAVEFAYTVTDSGTALPIDGVQVWISTDALGANTVWYGVTDAFGVARDQHGHLPRLDQGTYYFWKQRSGYIDDDNPDIEAVSAVSTTGAGTMTAVAAPTPSPAFVVVPCATRYAEAWEYGAFWCVGNILAGIHTGAGGGVLVDSTADFVNLGVTAGEGMLVYNTTQATSGPVVAVTATTITATGVTWAAGEAYQIVPLTGVERSTIENYLNVTAGNIHASLAAANACSCTLASWALDYLSKLNIIEAGAFHKCNCAQPGQRMSDAERQLWLTWSNEQLGFIRSGQIELCDGYAGSEWPSFDWAEQSTTEFAAGRIVINRQLKDR